MSNPQARTGSGSRPSLAVVVPELLPVPATQGGAVEYWVEEFIRRVDRELFDIRVVSRPSGKGEFAPARLVEIPWTPCERFFRKIKQALSWSNPLRALAKIQNVWSYGRRAAKAVADARVVYIHNEPNILLLLGPKRGRRIVLHMHNDHLSIPAFRFGYSLALSKADQVVFASHYLMDRASEAFPKHANRFVVVHNATDSTVFRPYGKVASHELADLVGHLPDDTELVLYVGRLVPQKGVDVLIEAFRLLLQTRPKAKLVVTGSSFFENGPKTEFVRNLVEQARSIQDSILFMGFLPHNRVKYLYSLADVVVFPSVWQEPFGLVAIEAMASGSCVVASSVGGVPEVIEDNRTGFLVPPGDVVRLAAKISECLADPARSRRIGLAAREAVIRRFSWDELVGKVQKIIEVVH
ncbi:MAG: glycosyltransferase family 4 protein [Fibrobacterota bacterium]|nr:glycosyltransferase family 4 protein [Fibrobacterota bacterium]QQS03785.1 MAG: glycosyltransferase family 4 protein [Fibrobacterota bacterium]